MGFDEEWRQVPDYPYEISSLGRVRRTGKARGAKVGRILKPNVMRVGYLSVNLSRNDVKAGCTYLHDLVCTIFHGPRPTPKHEVAHWDGDRTNCKANNLRWATRKENFSDMPRHGTRRFGEKHHGALLRDDLVIKIRAAAASGVTQQKLADAHGVSVGTIQSAISRKTWAHVR
jgi:hypothetical protein